MMLRPQVSRPFPLMNKSLALLTAFLFPVLLSAFGKDPVLFALVAASLLGAVVTWRFRIETTGMSLEEMDRQDSSD